LKNLAERAWLLVFVCDKVEQQASSFSGKNGRRFK
jgi:hypothetical protein